jgi:hypothetical protein
VTYAGAGFAIFAIISLGIGMWLVIFLARLREDLEATAVWMRSIALRFEESSDRREEASACQSRLT